MDEIEIDNLVIAFTYPHNEITSYFVWDKMKKKVVEISLWDGFDFEEGVLDDEELAKAIRNEDNSYVDIPRLEIGERITMMKDFTRTIANPSLKKVIDERVEEIIINISFPFFDPTIFVTVNKMATIIR